ncbi:hypothetical protein D3C78_1884290 [compost metagenome]
MIRKRPFRVQGEMELVAPAELEPRLGQRIVPVLRARMPLGEVCGMCSNFIGNDAFAHIILVRQA